MSALAQEEMERLRKERDLARRDYEVIEVKMRNKVEGLLWELAVIKDERDALAAFLAEAKCQIAMMRGA